MVTGSSGLLGSHLVPALERANHTVSTLVRRADLVRENARLWTPDSGRLDANVFDGVDAVVHLAGESVADGRWSDQKKRRIRRSRIDTTSLLANTIHELTTPPTVFVVASAVGFYGDRGDEPLGETAAAGQGFLADVCRAWELAAEPAREAGIQVVHTRFGLLLSKEGGALAKMLIPFRLGLGGPLGNGKQYMSWLALDDAVEAVLFLLSRGDVRGAVNVVSPNPVTNRDFAHALGKVLRRPAAVSVPAIAARLAMGEMADEMLLASQRVLPARLQELGFEFRFPELDGALRHALRD